MKPRIYKTHGLGWCCRSNWHIAFASDPIDAFIKWRWHRNFDRWCIAGILFCVATIAVKLA